MPQEKNDNQGGRRAEGPRESSGSPGQDRSSSDLKEREYRDKDGNVHHHTRTSREMEDKE